jgi:hypothetical protein
MTDDINEKPRRAKAKGAERLKTPRLHMTPAQFRKWVADMGYPAVELKAQHKIPYDTRKIAEDLGVEMKQIYAYWWASDSMDERVPMRGSIVRLCRALLKIKQLEHDLAVARIEISRLEGAAREAARKRLWQRK